MTEVLAVWPDGHTQMFHCNYTNLRDVIGGPYDFVRANDEMGIYIHDEGMLINLPLNVPVSLFAGRPLYGPAVICAADPNVEGDTLAPSERLIKAMIAQCALWQAVIHNAELIGQDVMVYPNADTIPPPQIIQFSGTEFEEYLNTGRIPKEDR